MFLVGVQRHSAYAVWYSKSQGRAHKEAKKKFLVGVHRHRYASEALKKRWAVFRVSYSYKSLEFRV